MVKKYLLSYLLDADRVNYLTMENIYGILSRKHSNEELVMYSRRTRLDPGIRYILDNYQDVRLVKLDGNSYSPLLDSLSSKMVKCIFEYEITNPETISSLAGELEKGKGKALIFNRSLLSHDGSLEISRDSRMDYDFFFWDFLGQGFTLAQNSCIFTRQFFTTPARLVFPVSSRNMQKDSFVYSPSTAIVSARPAGSRKLTYIAQDFRRFIRGVLKTPAVGVAPELKKIYRVCDDWLKTYNHYTKPIIFSSGEFRDKLKVTLGAGGVYQTGFLPTDVDSLDITNPADWKKLFLPGTIDNLVAEHVFEHLDDREVESALANCYHYLKSGGKLRIAVPDKFRKDAKYVNSVKPPSDGHKSYFSHPELTRVCQKAGFKVNLLEYYDRSGVFHVTHGDINEGFVRRSARFDTQAEFRKNKFHYTSLIIDAVKP